MTAQIYTVQKSGNLFFVRASVGRIGTKPNILRLLVNTGASQTSLSKTLLFELEYTGSDLTSKTSILTGNGIIQASIISVTSLNCLGQQVENFPVLAIDLSLSRYINGVLGMDFLLRFNAVIDIGKRQIVLPTNN
jgi:predicted aspartyl protease